MNRILSLLLITLMAFVGFACTETKQATTEEETTSTEMVTEETPSDIAFEVNILNDSIPSPRKEMVATIDGVALTVNYGSPSVKGRTIFGDLVPFDQVWRTGANEATWIEVSDDVTINGETLPKGKYGIFTIAGEKEWTIIFNEVWDQWGHYDYDKEKDILRIKVSPMLSEEFNERFTININEEGSVSLSWDQVVASFEID